MKKFKSYGFWTALAGAVVILINALGDLFGFKIESKLVENVIMGVAGVLVAVGVVSMNGKKDSPTVEENNNQPEEKKNQEEEQKQITEQENTVKIEEKTLKNEENIAKNSE
ncbi:MAG: hypothetical protein J6K97_03765 [Clostridia bacterium]|nr:hypothetical protein [Clostridia bacterium]